MKPLLHHSDRVFSIPSFLDACGCAQLIALAESVGFGAAGVRTAEGQKAMPAVRNNQRTLVEDRGWVETLWGKLLGVELPTLHGESPAGLPKDLRFYKYSPGQRFKMHKDGPWTERGFTSRLTFLVYLNDAFAGGETDFRDFKVSPQAGSALLFIHDTWHEGAAVTEGVKYVLRSDVLYGPAAAA
jgi:predicted 2-oxoglutarate/Fe(II)-dependent dioxygenase YbiX